MIPSQKSENLQQMLQTYMFAFTIGNLGEVIKQSKTITGKDRQFDIECGEK